MGMMAVTRIFEKSQKHGRAGLTKIIARLPGKE